MDYSVIGVLLGFAFFYPLLMSFVWISGGIIYFLRWERSQPRRDQPPELAEYPLVSLIVPCHNEGENVRETIRFLAAQDYPNIEIIAVNDGSRDDTGAQLDALLGLYPNLRVIHFAANQGKSMGLRMAALASNAEYLLCIDGDALLDKYATRWMMHHLLTRPRVGAVTGNPRIRNRSTLLGKLQVGEFSSIIGLIKRAQRAYGRVFCVSGVIGCFRKTALHRAGYWSTDMITEDIDLTWRLQLDHWSVMYEPNAMCWILMPETLKGLWRQRLRWAQGGVEVILRYAWPLLRSWRTRRMWPVFGEYVLSLLWAYVMAGLMLLWLLGQLVALPPQWTIPSLLPQWHGVILGATCLCQFALSMAIDRRYENGVGRNFYWMVWYPIAYWLLSMLTSVFALPKALAKKRGTRAVWVSPDRGIR
ncbi:biofilm PGA synthesis N-glycosyltransferase PgaC [Tahibacter aquaticus]|uniref:Poly-beta-1,6-N-acetyl-D-glucosamine synthase n=1 Tax=Tahibacter aquaticus TaxID=520092 RepID=A0A4R6Z096_9GAMM|nr:poly-beta-1,6-N-acetyl-D-glucosamine synthase [Tahibacter aquaticus]TDR44912.1 biofilm PGA synthesis N-glycosyltransferase PgaC [Tahibacter aquaticus]